MTRSILMALVMVALAPIPAVAQQPPEATPRYQASSLPACRSTGAADLIQCQAATFLLEDVWKAGQQLAAGRGVPHSRAKAAVLAGLAS